MAETKKADLKPTSAKKKEEKVEDKAPEPELEKGPEPTELSLEEAFEALAQRVENETAKNEDQSILVDTLRRGAINSRQLRKA